MDAQTTLGDTAAIAALVQSIVRAEVEGGDHLERRDAAGGPLREPLPRRARRDGRRADRAGAGRRVPARELLADLVAVCRPHAQELGCEAELDRVPALGAQTGAAAPARSRPLAGYRCRGSSASSPSDFLPQRRAPVPTSQRRSGGGSTNWETIRFAASRGSCPRGAARSGPRSRPCSCRRAAAPPWPRSRRRACPRRRRSASARSS